MTKNPDKRDLTDKLQFDYIIVGAGSAGCVLANRLSAEPGKTVCLIEAGGRDTSPLIDIPIGMMVLFNHPRLNWRFATIPQTHAGNRQIYTPRGKVLGGSSAINGMIYVRGHPEDYDDWEKAGNRGWSFREVLPYFRRSENNETWTSSPLHGTGGPLNVAELRSRNPSSDSFLEAAQSLQIPLCPDFNGPYPDGAGYRQVTQRDGRRELTARAFLKPALGRSNLTVFTDCLADTVLFEGRRARGVSLLRGNQTLELTARQEVILAAGAIGSPEILLRSGVGDPEHLSDLRIPVVHALPGVGRNWHDHPLISLACDTRSTDPYGISVAAFPRLVSAAFNYAFNRRGLLASNGVEAAAFARSAPELSRTDLQITFAAGKRGTAMFSYGHGYSIAAINLRPFGRGEMKLTARSPRAAPAIDPRFFADERDLDILVKAFKLSRRVLNAAPFERYGGVETMPGAAVNSDDDIRDYIRNASGTAYHPVGTCAMGTGPDAVVDATLKVHGVEGLRVVDASIMPVIIGGNTNAPTIMIAEKASDMILGRAPLPPVDWQDASRLKPVSQPAA